MVVICSVGHKSGIRCDHKRNNDGIFTCAINASKETCCFAQTEAEHTAKFAAGMKKLKEV